MRTPSTKKAGAGLVGAHVSYQTLVESIKQKEHDPGQPSKN
jgi:hypothetical protein